jgi:hypothetical protein
MHRILGRTSGNIAEIEMSGALTPEDYASLVDEMESLIADHGKTRILFDLSDLEASDFEALWDEATFDVAHAGEIHRIALVGEPEWKDWTQRVMPPFEEAEIAYFPPDALEKAMDWLTQ